MSQGTLVPAELRSGNPALSDAFIESQLSPAVAAPRTMSITVSPQRAAVLGALCAVCEGYCLVLDFGIIEAGVEAGAPKSSSGTSRSASWSP